MLNSTSHHSSLRFPARPQGLPDPHRVYDKVNEKFNQVQDWVDLSTLDGSVYDFDGNTGSVRTVIDFATNQPKLEKQRTNQDHAVGVDFGPTGELRKFSLYERDNQAQLSTYEYHQIPAYEIPDVFSYHEASDIKERNLPKENSLKVSAGSEPRSPLRSHAGEA